MDMATLLVGGSGILPRGRSVYPATGNAVIHEWFMLPLRLGRLGVWIVCLRGHGMLDKATLLVGGPVVLLWDKSGGPAICHAVVCRRLMSGLGTGCLQVWIACLGGSTKIVVRLRRSKDRVCDA